MLKVIGKMNGLQPVYLEEPEYVNRAMEWDIVDLGFGRQAYVKGEHLWFDIPGQDCRVMRVNAELAYEIDKRDGWAWSGREVAQ